MAAGLGYVVVAMVSMSVGMLAGGWLAAGKIAECEDRIRNLETAPERSPA